jgi:hydroxyquinol 1,2-dioxygenase
MKDLNEFTLTDAVIDRVRKAPDPRVRQISEALVRHAHAFIREIEPTQEEWAAGIQFLTGVGQMCSETRQECILLSDTLGISMLVDAINHRAPAGATENTVIGPFYVENPPERLSGDDISGGWPGTPLFAEGSVRSLDGTPLANIAVDVWHSDDDGFYDVQHLDRIARVHRPVAGHAAGRARFHTGEDGRFHFWSVKPAPYPIPHDGPVGQMLAAQGRHPYRPAHVHFMIDAPGYVKLVTHVFVAGSDYLDSDAVFGVKNSLIREYVTRPSGTAPDGRKMDQSYSYLHYDFVLNPASPRNEPVPALIAPVPSRQ